MKKTIFAGIVMAAVLMVGGSVLTPTASALTIDDIQAQIKELLAKVADLTQQLRALQGSGVQESSGGVVGSEGTSTAFTPSKHRVCEVLKRNLSSGAQGDDVQSLQEFLGDEGHFSANATGYFGSLTAEAVAKWQASQGVSSVGAVGPLSRERIKMWCGGGIGKALKATPTRGVAPLTVTFSTWLSGFRVANSSYTIDFGDGTSERAADCYAPADACIEPGHNTHTYTSDGMYTATLTKITDICAGDPACMAPISSEIVGKIQIHVGTQACTKEYQPVCGSKPIVCITTPCNPIQQTYGNRCMMEADGATILYEGSCRPDSANPEKDPRCKSWYDGCNSCSRSTVGGPAMCTLRACTSESMQKPYCTAYFDKDVEGNKPPVISGFSGPTTLTINLSGTWTIAASDPENGALSYRIMWGDYYPTMSPSEGSAMKDAFVQTTTFTHAYANAGTYTVTIVVRDAAGKEAKTSTTVKVGDGGVVCTMEYAPVCGRPPGCVPCSGGVICPAVCQLYNPVTYSNKCMLNGAGARFLYSGQCSTTTY